MHKPSEALCINSQSFEHHSPFIYIIFIFFMFSQWYITGIIGGEIFDRIEKMGLTAICIVVSHPSTYTFHLERFLKLLRDTMSLELVYKVLRSSISL